jgi:hypothetical protein
MNALSVIERNSVDFCFGSWRMLWQFLFLKEDKNILIFKNRQTVFLCLSTVNENGGCSSVG